jgi:NO-binding membrane sensor protein with MHYT domain
MNNYDITVVAVSYIMSVLGSFMALYIVRAALRAEAGRNKLLIFAAICLGGVGIWSMHFIGMLALDMETMAMNFNWGLTAFSLLVGIVGVYAGLFIMGHGEMKFAKLIMAGIVVGSAVVAMHYTGMGAMEMQADIKWDWTIINISVAIAVVASIVALWLAVNVKQMWQIAVSALVMGVAVCGMHYTGMAAAEFVANPSLPAVSNMETTTFMLSTIITAVNIVTLIIALVVVMLESNKQSNNGVLTKS